MYVCLGCGRLPGQGDISRSPYGAKGQHMHEDVFGLKKRQVLSNQRGGMRTMLSSLTGLRVRVPAALPVLTRSGSKWARS